MNVNGQENPGDLSVSRNVAIGGRAKILGDVRVGHDLRVDGWLEAKNIKGAVKGVFESEVAMRRRYSYPLDGWMAIVASSRDDEVMELWLAYNGDWHKQGLDVSGFFTLDWDVIELMKDKVDGLEGRIDTAAEDISSLDGRKADKAYVDAGLGRKADKAYVDAGLGSKADKAYVDAGLGSKADKAYVDAGLGSKADKAYVDAGLGSKADKAYVDTELGLKAPAEQVRGLEGRVSAVETALDGVVDEEALAKYAELSYVNEQLRGKASASQVSNLEGRVEVVESGLAGKASTDDVSEALEEYAELAYVNDELSRKASQTDVNNIEGRLDGVEGALANRPSAEDLAEALEEYALASETTEALDGKADKTDVNRLDGKVEILETTINKINTGIKKSRPEDFICTGLIRLTSVEGNIYRNLGELYIAKYSKEEKTSCRKLIPAETVDNIAYLLDCAPDDIVWRVGEDEAYFDEDNNMIIDGEYCATRGFVPVDLRIDYPHSYYKYDYLTIHHGRLMGCTSSGKKGLELLPPDKTMLRYKVVPNKAATKKYIAITCLQEPGNSNTVKIDLEAVSLIRIKDYSNGEGQPYIYSDGAIGWKKSRHEYVRLNYDYVMSNSLPKPIYQRIRIRSHSNAGNLSPWKYFLVMACPGKFYIAETDTAGRVIETPKELPRYSLTNGVRPPSTDDLLELLG